MFSKILICLITCAFSIKFVDGQTPTKHEPNIIIEFWEEINNKVKVFDKYYFDNNNYLISYVSIDPYKINCNLIDSIVFINDYMGNCIKQIEYVPDTIGVSVCRTLLREQNIIQYVYNDEGDLVDMSGTFETFQVYKRYYLEVDIQDSLNLLNLELVDINTVIKNANISENEFKTIMGKKVLIKRYEGDFVSSILTQYNIPQNTKFKSMSICLFENRLIMDKFILDGYIVTRQYEYDKGRLIKRITITVKPDSGITEVIKQGFAVKKI
ncbi:MAG: hypothetical protein IPH61_15160 [Bacteroidetes bacterium]|nr:hypothetical protein [Bacteroidota bacterium]